jgi:hypothetical protein
MRIQAAKNELSPVIFKGRLKILGTAFFLLMMWLKPSPDFLNQIRPAPKYCC